MMLSSKGLGQGHLLGGGVLGDGLGALRDGVLGQFTRQQKANSCLDFPRGDGGTLVVVSKARCFSCNALEDVTHERVHDGHSLGGNTSVRVDLLQHLVDVDTVGFLPPALLLLISLSDGFLGLASLLGCLSGGFRWHDDTVDFDGNIWMDGWISGTEKGGVKRGSTQAPW